MDVRTGFSVVLVGVLTVVATLVVRPFLSYLLAAMLLAFVLVPLQRRLEDVVGPRPAALALVASTVVLVVAPAAAFVDAVLGEVPTEAPIRRLSAPIVAAVERTVGVEVRLDRVVSRVVDALVDAVSGSTSEFVSAGLHAFLGVLLLLFVLYYLLVDRDRLLRWIERVTPLPPDVQEELYDVAETTTWAVLKGHVFIASVQGVVAGLGLVALGVPDAVFWTAVMMVLAMVPIVGVSPVLGGATLYLLVQRRPLAAGLLVAWGITTVAITDDYLRAYVVDRESSLHSAVVLLGVFGGTYLLGAIGLFVGPILLGLFVATIDVLAAEYDLAGPGERDTSP